MYILILFAFISLYSSATYASVDEWSTHKNIDPMTDKVTKFSSVTTVDQRQGILYQFTVSDNTKELKATLIIATEQIYLKLITGDSIGIRVDKNNPRQFKITDIKRINDNSSSIATAELNIGCDLVTDMSKGKSFIVQWKGDYRMQNSLFSLTNSSISLRESASRCF